MSNFILFLLEHQPTIPALMLVALVAFVAGAAFQFCEDDKKTAKQ